MNDTLNALKQWTPNLVQLSNAIAKAETGFENGRPEAGMMEAFHYLLGLAYDEINAATFQEQQTAALAPNWAGEFKTYEQWVNKGQSWLKSPSHRPAICVDAKGRRCALGADMIRARDEGAFPVRYFWDCEPDTTARRETVVMSGRQAGKTAAIAHSIIDAMPDKAKARTSMENVQDVMDAMAKISRGAA